MSETLSSVLPREVEQEITRLLHAVCDANLRLATAESCTGGLLASLLTDVQGCGHAFDRSFVAYTGAAKREMLGVSAATLERYGAVSRAVAIEMAEGALKNSDADVAFAVTGFAGPGGDCDEEGLVHFACARKGRDTVHEEAHFGPAGRGQVRLECVGRMVTMLREMLK
ncbi:CinA family protein [Tranquillimonas alkanivorans]|uniref:Nicotinamide-nucleotide amidase n=1 Tax=Tranquillimonas alkanivorans TaxID=441119 RepID=A0A1I5LJ51_9RHOB|nr:nicotinamide-nucleotide amidase [Tranquillimonas alkanivorans]